MFDDEQWEKLVTLATELGAADGKAVGTWFFDGNTSLYQYESVLRWIEEGDPILWDNYRSPLSGEYADDLTPDALMRELGVHGADLEEITGLCLAYEDAHLTAWSDEIERVARYQLA